MEAFLGHLIHFALWAFFAIFAFAVIGFIATIRWIIGLVNRTETAVGSGIDSAERGLRLKR